MRLYEDGEFIDKEDERRGIRDTYREAFFGSLGVERTKEPFLFSGASTDINSNVLNLITKAISLHGDDTSALISSLATISESALGPGTLSNSIGSILSYPSMTVASLAMSHFNLDGQS
ncbi:hypothetical protein LQ948_18660 [Jiella sp. MQZ9-1]|uniref:Uncharacterized protein n=1 Tax=Jiella flava TaxID=2816857 RepID=A0A939G2N4_9HYPH|nr:hypothetical protein [Jiella flava]MBO0664601.1 hypothetical protein [Jiella flava]MCD2473211.1 hypothetical protein [Jiella flava]